MISCCSPPSKYKPVTHVIFDLDGTLTDSEKVVLKFYEQLALEHGKTFTKEMHVKTVGNLKQKTLEILIKELELPFNVEQLNSIFNERVYKDFQEVELCKGARELIEHLHAHNIPMGVATSSPRDEIEIKFTNYQDLKEKFQFIISSSDPQVKNNKPAPDIYLAAAEKFKDKPSPESCLVFEDSTIGLKAALAAKMQVVLIPSFHIPYEVWKNATVRIDSLDQTPLPLFRLPVAEFTPGPKNDLGLDIDKLIVEKKSEKQDENISSNKDKTDNEVIDETIPPPKLDELDKEAKKVAEEVAPSKSEEKEVKISQPEEADSSPVDESKPEPEKESSEPETAPPSEESTKPNSETVTDENKESTLDKEAPEAVPQDNNPETQDIQSEPPKEPESEGGEEAASPVEPLSTPNPTESETT